MDRIDEEIVSILTSDGRASYRTIGQRVGLSSNAAAARVQRLCASGIILGFRAILAEDQSRAAGQIEAFIDVRLQPGKDSDEFLVWAMAEPSVMDAVHVTGPYDYLLHVSLRDTAGLDKLLRRIKQTGGASQTQTRLALRSRA